MATGISQAQLTAFRDAAQSLKLYRRAELGGADTIEELYVDPLPNDHVLNTMIKPNTTFIIGRKGTGKSTVFLRAQHELRKTDGLASAYVDIKTVYESAQASPQALNKAASMQGSLSEDEIEQLLLYRQFLGAVVTEIRRELEDRIKVSIWKKLKRTLGGSLKDLFAGLDALLDHAHEDHFVNVVGNLQTQNVDAQSDESTTEDSTSATLKMGGAPSADLSGTSTSTYNSTTERERQYTDVLLRTFNVRDYISELRLLLERVGIKHLHVFIDDFSELPPEAMKIVVDSIIAPLNNWSDELVKFKIAAYPGRIYYGQVDKTKIDEVNLDLYALYGTADLATMEEKAIDFTRRLIERRLLYFGADDPRGYFGGRAPEEVWRQLFYATMANPRNLGYILYFLYEAELLYGRFISLRSIREAARRYYEEKIEAYFLMRRFLHETFEERSSIFSLKELLDEFVERARELRSHQALGHVHGRPPTSHFHVVTDLDTLVATLELNFFLTKYFVMKDRDGRPVTVFALNYGLCEKETISFGRPQGRREDRLYYVERVFDYTAILQTYLKTNQEIRCGNCDATFETEMLATLRVYGMECPTCRNGTCSVTNLSRKYEATLKAVNEASLLPQIELGIIQTLGTEQNPQVASDVAGELDCSYQMIGKRAKILSDRGLVNREQYEGARRVFSITDSARQIYFEPVDPSDG